MDSFAYDDWDVLRARVKGVSTFNNVASTLNTMVKAAAERGHIDKESFTFPLLKRADEPVEFYNFEEFEELVDAAHVTSTTAEVIVLLGGEAGLRRSEMYPLLWSSCNVPRRQLMVSTAEVIVKRKRSPAPMRARGMPKGNQYRVVRMTDRVVRALERHRAARGGCDGRVLTRLDGAPFTDHPFRDLLVKVQRRAGSEFVNARETAIFSNL